MPSQRSADYWRDRAEEARAQADQMRDPSARRTLLDIADENYGQLAQQAEAMGSAGLYRPNDE
jgi:hypothetical protein